MEFFIAFFKNSTKIITQSFLVFFVLSHFYLLTVAQSSESQTEYLIAFTLIFLFVGGPCSRIYGEMSETLNNNLMRKTVVVNFSLFLKELQCVIIFYVVGYFTEKSKNLFILDIRNFLYIETILAVIILLVHILRRFFEDLNYR